MADATPAADASDKSPPSRVWLEAWPSPKGIGHDHVLDFPSHAREMVLLREWITAKSEGAYDRADAIRDALRDSGCNPRHARGACAGRRAVTSREEGDSDAPWAENLRYDPGWHSRNKEATLVSQQSLLARTPGWAHTPRVS